MAAFNAATFQRLCWEGNNRALFAFFHALSTLQQQFQVPREGLLGFVQFLSSSSTGPLPVSASSSSSNLPSSNLPSSNLSSSNLSSSNLPSTYPPLACSSRSLRSSSVASPVDFAQSVAHVVETFLGMKASMTIDEVQSVLHVASHISVMDADAAKECLLIRTDLDGLSRFAIFRPETGSTNAQNVPVTGMASSQLPEPASMQSASQKHEPSVNREHHCISELFSDGSEQEMEVEEKEEPMAINDTARTPNSNNAQGPAPRSITAKSSESSRVKHFVDTFREYNVDKLHAIGQELHDRLPAMELFRVAVLQQGLPALGQHKSLQSLAKAKQIFEQWLRFYKNQKRSRDSVFITAILLVLISETYEQLNYLRCPRDLIAKWQKQYGTLPIHRANNMKKIVYELGPSTLLVPFNWSCIYNLKEEHRDSAVKQLRSFMDTSHFKRSIIHYTGPLFKTENILAVKPKQKKMTTPPSSAKQEKSTSLSTNSASSDVVHRFMPPQPSTSQPTIRPASQPHCSRAIQIPGPSPRSPPLQTVMAATPAPAALSTLPKINRSDPSFFYGLNVEYPHIAPADPTFLSSQQTK